MSMPIDAKTFKPTGHGQIFECDACSFKFVYPRPVDTKDFYDLDAYYTQGASHFVQRPEDRLATRLRVHLAWRFDRSETLSDVILSELPNKGELLDIGCGGGGLIDQLSGEGFKMTGVERDVAALSHRQLNVLEGSAENLPPLPQASFDGVVFSHVLEHLNDPVAAVRNAAKLLRPGGKLFCEVPNNESMIAEQSKLSWEHLDIPRHINFFSEKTLRKLMAAAGLTTSRTYFGGYTRYFGESYIATEQRIHDRLAAIGTNSSTRNSPALAWKLLTKTALAPAVRKYDSVGLVAAEIKMR
jgi:SAM-dependent methyltransferase